MEGVVSKDDIFDLAVIMVAGRAAEQIFLNQKYHASGFELKNAYEILKQSVEIGNYNTNDVYPSSFGSVRQDAIAHKKIIKLLKKALKKAKKIINENLSLIKTLHDELLIKGTLTGLELKEFVDGDIVDQSFATKSFRRYRLQ